METDDKEYEWLVSVSVTVSLISGKVRNFDLDIKMIAVEEIDAENGAIWAATEHYKNKFPDAGIYSEVKNSKIIKELD